MRNPGRRKADRQPEAEGGGAPDWMVTYGDLMSLLLTFFVLIVSFSSIQESGFNKAMGSLKSALGVLKFHPSAIQPKNVIVVPIGSSKKGENEGEEDFEELLGYIKEHNLQDSIEVEVSEDGVMIRMAEPILFDLGKSDLKQSVFVLLARIGKLVKNWPNKTRVEGHTDDLPISTAEFPSNWELSAARAISVIHFFQKVSFVDPQKIYYSGYGEYKPLVPNISTFNRGKNRRVEIYLEQAENNPQEVFSNNLLRRNDGR